MKPTSHPPIEGPFGLPMTDQQARHLDALLKSLPADSAFAYRRLATPTGLARFQAEERTDISWITVEAPDLAGDLVLTSGMDDSHFALNPIVTLNHRYDQPPVGRSLWRRGATSASRTGVRAKTYYPPRPAGWTASDWPPDVALDLVRAGLLLGKSIGFVPLEVRPPNREELRANPRLTRVRSIIEKWLLLEYSCCFLPMQPQAVVEETSVGQHMVLSQLQQLLGSARVRKNIEKLARLSLQSRGNFW